MFFFLVIVLHGLPFTRPMPYPDVATCEAEGKIATANAGAGAYSFCVQAQTITTGEKFFGRRLSIIQNPMVKGDPAPSLETAPTFLLTLPDVGQ